jgi:hypothetical protein
MSSGYNDQSPSLLGEVSGLLIQSKIHKHRQHWPLQTLLLCLLERGTEAGKVRISTYFALLTSFPVTTKTCFPRLSTFFMSFQIDASSLNPFIELE